MVYGPFDLNLTEMPESHDKNEPTLENIAINEQVAIQLDDDKPA